MSIAVNSEATDLERNLERLRKIAAGAEVPRTRVCSRHGAYETPHCTECAFELHRDALAYARPAPVVTTVPSMMTCPKHGPQAGWDFCRACALTTDNEPQERIARGMTRWFSTLVKEMAEGVGLDVVKMFHVTESGDIVLSLRRKA